MQIVIDVPDKTYEYYVKLSNKSDEQLSAYERLILNGILLPKGHGRLIDADELRTKSIDVNAEFGNKWWCVDCDDIELAPTVLEADNVTNAQ